MSNLKTIDGGKKAKQATCPYCGLVPADKHPDFSCPRLSGMAWTDDSHQVEYIEPDKWDYYVKTKMTTD